MDIVRYKSNLINKMIVDSPGYLRQRLINDIIDNNIGTYGNSKDGVIKLSKMTQKQKIEECVNGNNRTIQLLDLLEMKKGYKYSILYKYNNFSYEKLKKNGIDIFTEYYKYSMGAVPENQMLFMEDEENIYLKLHKYIQVLDKEILKKKIVRYPILVVMHKKLKILELKFDKLYHENDNNFFKTTIEAKLAYLEHNIELSYMEFRLEKTVKELVENYDSTVKPIIWSFETARAKGLTLKVGQDGIMPFIGELELLLNDMKLKYKNQDKVIECINNIDEYLENTKRFANERFRILSWIKILKNKEYINLEKTIDLKVIFRYANTNLDLINIYDVENNDMERIDYVIKFIGNVAKEIGEL